MVDKFPVDGVVEGEEAADLVEGTPCAALGHGVAEEGGVSMCVCLLGREKRGKRKSLPHGAERLVGGCDEAHARVFLLVAPAFSHLFDEAFGVGTDGGRVGVVVREVRLVGRMRLVGALSHVDNVPVAACRMLLAC